MTSGRAAEPGPETGGEASHEPAPDGDTSIPAATRWIAWLFMIGSALFASASVPMLGSVVPAGLIGAMYFVGSLFFTSASTLVAATTWRDLRSADDPQPFYRSIDWWAAMIQLVGTLWFNINTYNAMADNLSVEEENLRVWTPGIHGSLCFLISSYLSFIAVCHRAWCFCRHDRNWRIAELNLLGSAFFIAAAIAAFVLPSTGEALDASIVNAGTCIGALCFLWGARLLLIPDTKSSAA